MTRGSEDGRSSATPRLDAVMATSRVVAFRPAFADITGDVVSGIFLSQLVYWQPRTRVERDGKRWVVKAARDWWVEVRVTEDQARRSLKVLRDKGLVETNVWKWNGTPMTHITLVPDAMEQALAALDPTHDDPDWQVEEPDGDATREDPDSIRDDPESNRDDPKSTRAVAQVDSGQAPGALGRGPKSSTPTERNSESYADIGGESRRPRRKTRIPDDFAPTERSREIIAARIPLLDLEAETEKFCDYYRATGKTHEDWQSAWMYWMRQAPTRGGVMRPAPARPAGRHQPTKRPQTGRVQI